jgi:hypothetical protein
MQRGSLRRHFSITQKSTFMLGQELAKIALMFILIHFSKKLQKTTNFAFGRGVKTGERVNFYIFYAHPAF